MQYSKHKDASPEDTINRIKSIISGVGIETNEIWVDSGIENAYSNHVSIPNTSFGTNGKGTSREYALASGYAELIERLQTGILKAAVRYDRVADEVGFHYSPDEEIRSAEEIVEQNDSYTRFFYNFFSINTTEEKKSFLKQLPRMEMLPRDRFRCLPFVDLFTENIMYIPTDLLFPICGSNGMAAGNTPEEALVQALCEILERYANKAVLDGVVPPEIPREYWNNAGVVPLIDEIEKDDRYRVSIRDCSLGRGLPVTAVVISDCFLGKFGVHFGCHPCFEVAVERCLTEALQGKRLENAASMNEIGDDRLCNSVDNGPNLMKLGYGAYPICFFANKPTYRFHPWKEWADMTNIEMVKALVDIIRKEGYDVLIRDASHLGFPTYHVLVPGMSELFLSDGRRFKELRTAQKVIDGMKHFPALSLEEEDRLLLFMKYKEFSIVENSFGWIANIPIKGELYKTERIRAFLHFKRKEYIQAYEWFSRAAQTVNNKSDRLLLSCAAEYAWLMNICHDQESVSRAISSYYTTDIATIVCDLLHDPSQVMIKAFESFPCNNCSNCSHNGVNCDYKNNEEVLRKIQTAMRKSKVIQSNVLELLRSEHIS